MNYSSSNTPEGIDVETTKQYDFFISHASEDKEDIVRALADALVNNGFRVWYDEFELKIGDSLRKRLNKFSVRYRYYFAIVYQKKLDRIRIKRDGSTRNGRS